MSVIKFADLGDTVVSDEIISASARSVWSRPVVVVRSISEITKSGNNSNLDGQVNNDGLQQSDVRLKRDITEVGATPDGLKLYSFRYNWSEETFVGVMAQEVQDLMPHALSTGEDGFMRVNYDKIGIPMISVDRLRARRCIQ